jgi:DNA-binding MarR family transcriptional regulator
MPDMIYLDKLLKLHSILNEIVSITRDAEFNNSDQLSVKIYQLLDMLVHMQSLNISIRTELIEKFISIRPDLSHKIKDQIKKGADIIVLYDRRKVNPDRRTLHTYLANDQRIGIVDRRNNIKSKRAEISSH